MSEQLLLDQREVMQTDVVEAPTDIELALAVEEALVGVEKAIADGVLEVSSATSDERVPQKQGIGNDTAGKHTNW